MSTAKRIADVIEIAGRVCLGWVVVGASLGTMDPIHLAGQVVLLIQVFTGAVR